MSSGQPPGIQTLNNFPGLRTLHLGHALLLSTVGNVATHFMVRSDHSTPCFTDFLCITLQVQISQPHLQVQAHPCSRGFLISPNLALTFTLQHLNPLYPSDTLTSMSSSVPLPSPLQWLIHRAL